MPLNREGAVDAILNCLHDRDVVIGTTGMLSRELFELRENRGQGHEKDFLTVGSMGHASAIALGVALNRPRRQVNLTFINYKGNSDNALRILLNAGRSPPSKFQGSILLLLIK